MRRWLLGLSSVICCLATAPAATQAIMQLRPPSDPTPMTGQPQIVNTSAIALNGKRVVFFGVDPAMARQPCSIGNRNWDCGTAAYRTLMNLIGREPVTCEPRGVDIFSRIFAKCTVHGEDIGKALVEAGLAVAVPEETKDYVDAEAKAKASKKGMWQGTFMTPSEFREAATGHPQGR